MNQSVINNLAAKINSKEQKSNKVTSLSSSSTDTQYPSAKAVYDRINALELQVGEDYGTFAELQAIIDNAQSGDTIILDKDYKNSGNEDCIEVEKTLKIVGNGHIIDADKHSVIFELSYNVRNTLFDNITFLNGEEEYYNGGAIWGSDITVTNCNFINCKAAYEGGAISGANLKIYDSSFINCCVENEDEYEADGGAIYCYDEIETINCIFLNNSAAGTGAAIWYDSNDEGQHIDNCIFKDNVAPNGYGLYSESNVNVYNCIFENTTTYNFTNLDYLTSHQDITGKENINNKVSSWSSPTTDTNYPTEKLVKDSLDGKADSNHNHRIYDIDNISNNGATAIMEDCDSNGEGIGFADTFLIFNQQNDKLYYNKNGNADYDQDNEIATLGDINSGGGAYINDFYDDSTNEDIVIDFTNVIDVSNQIVTSWNSTTSNSKIPSEKLVKDSLDGHTHTISQITDYSTTWTNLVNDGTYLIRYKRDRVQFMINTDTSTSFPTTFTAFGGGAKVPDGYRPYSSVVVPCKSNYNLFVAIRPDGTVERKTNATSSQNAGVYCFAEWTL